MKQMERIGRGLVAIRYIILLGVAISLVLSLALLIIAVGRGVLALEQVIAAITSVEEAKLLIVECIELADVILLAVALYIIGIGLFELFIAPTPMPAWLTITSFEDLKSRLINIVAVALGVSFLGQVVTWDGVTNLLALGVGIGAVIVALSIFGALRLGRDETAPPPAARPNTRQGADV